MQYSSVVRTSARSPRTVAGAAVIILGAALSAIGLSAGTVSGEEPPPPPPTQTVPLNNLEAPTENTPECPNATDDFWHFVIAEGQGFSFVSITLNLDGKPITFTGEQIILNPNNQKPDNVYVRVPDGYDFDDLVKEGSSAEITPDAPSVKFVLSHFCDGPGSSTTSTTTTLVTTTTVATTTTAPTTTVVATTTTPTTSVEQQTPTTVLVGQAGPTTTLAGSVAATTSPLQVELPRTGLDGTGAATLIGALLMLVGAALLGLARRDTV